MMVLLALRSAMYAMYACSCPASEGLEASLNRDGLAFISSSIVACASCWGRTWVACWALAEAKLVHVPGLATLGASSGRMPSYRGVGVREKYATALLRVAIVWTFGDIACARMSPSSSSPSPRQPIGVVARPFKHEAFVARRLAVCQLRVFNARLHARAHESDRSQRRLSSLGANAHAPCSRQAEDEHGRVFDRRHDAECLVGWAGGRSRDAQLTHSGRRRSSRVRLPALRCDGVVAFGSGRAIRSGVPQGVCGRS